ncbi:MAG TPA: DUF2249 domain-containing protein [Verrucomicrobiota bacterium]|jgi:hypothetical protein|nr:DUF2249 domain-containing protein [Verrucomicrobiota bacterium]OQC68166.1 MAG: hypothetical protein BWX48_00171 [Verrucomicrobia bacterium ADurb.Bin006]HOI36909.1 DUF2249 domain-containing protein [Bacillota bacterium]HOA62726.1 DUF2249 domain-containing protein [Verrucomicrobiota bacterium]HOR72901.1 DUF2249 domain-containing protein [Verrucomicrobiota bacterium]
MNEKIVTFDMRGEAVRSLEPWEPLSKVIWTASQLRPDQTLALITSFEPVLLMRIIASIGFLHESELTSGGAWNVSFYRSPVALATEPDGPGARSGQSDSARAFDMDVRGLMPTPPLVKIVGALTQMPGPVELRILSTERLEELHCCPELEGLVAESVTLADGSHLTHIKSPVA